jgi:hypothetical protein
MAKESVNFIERPMGAFAESGHYAKIDHFKFVEENQKPETDQVEVAKPKESPRKSLAEDLALARKQI